MKQPKRLVWIALIVLINLILDQGTKWIAKETIANSPTKSYLWDTFRLTYAENRGAFLSMFSTLPESVRFWLLNIGVGLLLLGLLIYSATSKQLETMHVIGYAIIAGGGISNWLDRAFRDGSVVDFMNMGIGTSLRTGIFNVADVAILIGIGLLLIYNKKPENKSEVESHPTA